MNPDDPLDRLESETRRSSSAMRTVGTVLAWTLVGLVVAVVVSGALWLLVTIWEAILS